MNKNAIIKVKRCKKNIMWSAIYQGGHRRQCKRYAVKDGYCRQHHPDEKKKRENKRAKRLELIPFSMIHRY